jgi:hypothetical protein
VRTSGLPHPAIRSQEQAASSFEEAVYTVPLGFAHRPPGDKLPVPSWAEVQPGRSLPGAL